MSEMVSAHGQAMEVMRDAIRDLEVTMIRDKEEVQCRRNFYIREKMFDGITLHPLPHQYADGTIGTIDEDYPVAVTFCQRDSGDGILTDDTLEQSVHEVAQRFSTTRLGLGNLPSVSEHVCRVVPGNPRYPTAKFPEWRVRQLIVHVWSRSNSWRD